VNSQNIPVIVITGGPCAGKSTALNYIPEKLWAYGISSVTVPETATELLMNNVRVNQDGLSQSDFEYHLMMMMIEKEARYLEILKNYPNNKKVLICDRGLMDARPYLSPGEFEAVIEAMGLSTGQIFQRYSAVFHLITAASGAPSFYTKENNNARIENVEQAIQKDEENKNAWTGHPHLRIIDNSTDFEGKMKRLLQAICHHLGVPEPLEIERRFLVDPISASRICEHIKVAKVPIEQCYLKSAKDGHVRVRRWGDQGSASYYRTIKRRISEGTRTETESSISPREYFGAIQNEKDERFEIIQKIRHCFIWQNQYFELDIFTEPEWCRGIAILEIELTNFNDEVLLPPFININSEITGNKKLGNRELARKR